MRRLAISVLATGSWLAASFAGLAPAAARQLYLYPPEVRIRPVVMTPDPSLQRHYWDPRYCEVYETAAWQRWHCLRDGLHR